MFEDLNVEPDYYLYRGIVKSAYDADTIRVDIDLGFNIWQHNESIRLYGIDAPEVRGDERPEGLIARDWIRDKLIGQEITLRTIKDKSGKYGRLLGVIFLDGVNINNELVQLGLAVKREY